MAAPAVSASYRAAHIAATKELDFTFSGYNEQVGQLQGISAVSIYVLYAFGMEATDKEKEARVLKKLFVASVTSPRYEESSFKICLTQAFAANFLLGYLLCWMVTRTLS